MIELRQVDLIYNERSSTAVHALKQLDLEIPTGQFVTVVGSNGSGKSSTIKVIGGEHRPSRGTVHIGGKDVTRLPEHRRAAMVGRVFDNPLAGTAPTLSIEDNLAFAASRGARRTLRPAVTAARRRLMRERLASLGLSLEDRLESSVSLLSAGQRQSVTMIMAALTRPEVLLLDEHLAALDPGTQRVVLGLTVELVRELGCTTLMVTHNMDRAIEVGDRLLVMGAGRIVADVSGSAKAALTVDEIVASIGGAGDIVSDRVMLREG